MKDEKLSRLQEVENLFDYFNDRVQVARSARSLAISDDTALYLAQLLADRARSDRPAPAFDTLAEIHGQAANAPPGRRAELYRELGDRALYLLGCFRDHLDRARRPIGPSYYADMGAAAYASCDTVLKLWFSDAFGPVFRELARTFGDCVGVLETVKESDQDERITPSGLFLPGGIAQA